MPGVTGVTGGLPKFRAIAVQTERAVQRGVRVIHPLGRILFDRFREGVQEAPSGGLAELFVPRVFELAEDRDDIA